MRAQTGSSRTKRHRCERLICQVEPYSIPMICESDVREPGIVALLERHWSFAAAHSPAECVHALDLDGLGRASVTFWTIDEGGGPVGCVALQELEPAHGEIKSMHVAEEARGRGLGEKLLRHVIGEARRRGYARLSLETGNAEAFEPARRLYQRFGFVECPPFADYADHWFSVCMTMELEREGR